MINSVLSEFGVNGDIRANTLFLYLLYSEITGPSQKAWKAYYESWKERTIKDLELKEEEEKKDKALNEAINLCDKMERAEIYAAVERDDKHRVTPEKIDSLSDGEVFVFGSNKDGHHMGGAAKAAAKYFGAIWGQGDGLQGQSYAISSMEGLLSMAKNINRFVKFATEHQELKFFVTPIGCGIAGYKPEHVAPLFRKAILLQNVTLPRTFWEYYLYTEY